MTPRAPRHDKQHDTARRDYEQARVERADVAASDCHRERVGRKRNAEQQRARDIEARARGLRRGRRGGHMAVGEEQRDSPTGTFARKTARQPNAAISTPPSDGPSAVPSADIVPSSPIALPSCSRGTLAATNARLSAIDDRRAKTLRRAGGDQDPERRRGAAEGGCHREHPQPPQEQAPPTREVTEASRVTIIVVMASRYASTTHWTAWNEAPKAVVSAGKATFAMLAPIDDNNIASESAASAPARKGMARHARDSRHAGCIQGQAPLSSFAANFVIASGDSQAVQARFWRVAT